jgi:hypothetical protein
MTQRFATSPHYWSKSEKNLTHNQAHPSPYTTTPGPCTDRKLKGIEPTTKHYINPPHHDHWPIEFLPSTILLSDTDQITHSCLKRIEPMTKHPTTPPFEPTTKHYTNPPHHDHWPIDPRSSTILLTDTDGGHLGWVVELNIERNLPPVTPNEPPKNRTSRPKRWSEIQWKPNPRWPSWMSGGADHRKEPSSSHPPTIGHREIETIDAGVCPLIDRNQIQDGHLGWAAELILERNLPLDTSKPQKNWINRPRHLSYNWRKPNV